MFLFSFGSSRNRDLGKLSAQPEDITGPQDDRSSSKSGPKGENPGLESACPCSPRQALSSPHTLGGAKDTSSRRKARSQPGRTRLGAAEFSGFPRRVRVPSGWPPRATVSSHQKDGSSLGKGLGCAARRWESCPIGVTDPAVQHYKHQRAKPVCSSSVVPTPPPPPPPLLCY